MMKKRIILGLVSLLCIPPLLVTKATEFEGKEDEYTEKCKNSDSLSKSDLQVCAEFSDYLKEKNAKIEDEIEKTEQQLSQTLESIDDTKAQLTQTQTLMASVQNEIFVLEAQIEKTIQEIEKKEAQLASRMYFLQSYVNGNEYLYLLLKSDSLDQLLTRIQNIDELTEYDKDLITGLSLAKIELEKTKEEANLRYNDLFVLQTQQMTLLTNLGEEASQYSQSLDEIRDTLAGNRVDIGFIDDSLSEAERKIKAQEEREKAEAEAKRLEEERKKAEEEAKRLEEEKNKAEQDENNSQEDSNPTTDNETNNDTSLDTNTETTPPPTDLTIQNGIVSIAKSKVGCSYVYGGTGPNVFDCSGFAQWVYRQNGIYIPRTVTSQYYACELVDSPEPGDLLFFNTTGFLGHVGIYIGGDLFIHAGTSSTGVCYGNLSYTYWQNCYQGAGRFR